MIHKPGPFELRRYLAAPGPVSSLPDDQECVQHKPTQQATQTTPLPPRRALGYLAQTIS
ncbi:MAG: hypothetical protein Q9181_005838 [Wetmoreana brouardii]